MFGRLIVVFALFAAGPAAAQDKLIVFAAASLAEALGDVGKAYASTGRPAPVMSFAASAALARQIENGAPAALFISADEEWMDYLADRHLIDPASRLSLLGNSLVLVAPKGGRLDVSIAPQFDLAGALNGRKLALADPTSVPAGRYARASLTFLGVWKQLEPLVVRADNVRAALTFVERREAGAGIVYATDAALTDRVRVVGVFPPETHPPISYPLATITRHDSAAARAFRAFLLGDSAKAVFRRYGFAVR